LAAEAIALKVGMETKKPSMSGGGKTSEVPGKIALGDQAAIGYFPPIQRQNARHSRTRTFRMVIQADYMAPPHQSFLWMPSTSIEWVKPTSLSAP
jgi:hypothetical protein